MWLLTALVLTFLTPRTLAGYTYSRTREFEFDTKLVKDGAESWDYVDDTGTEYGSNCKFYLKHQGQIDVHTSVKNPWAQDEDKGSQTWRLRGYTCSIHDDITIATTCSDGVLIDWARLTCDNGSRKWGLDNHVGWCLSKDKGDWSGGVYNKLTLQRNSARYKNRCWQQLRWLPNGRVWGKRAGYNDPANVWWDTKYTSTKYITGRRRYLNSEGNEVEVPTLDDVAECEQDEGRPQEECTELVAQMWAYQESNTEEFEEVELRSPNPEDEYVEETEMDSESDEPTTDDRRVLKALKRILRLKA